MKHRYRLFRRTNGGNYYVQDNITNKQESLRTKDKTTAESLQHARNESVRQPGLNIQLARAYLTGSDALSLGRTWQMVMDDLVRVKSGVTRERYEHAMKSHKYDPLRKLPLLQTQATDLLEVIESGGTATNEFLRRLHCFALDMNWLPRAVLPKRQWPPMKFGEKRGITRDEHERLVAYGKNPEWKAYLELLWHVGGSQGDMANLRAEDIDWKERRILYVRRKTGSICRIHFGDELEKLLRNLPSSGVLFPKLAKVDSSKRETVFHDRCKRLKIEGVTLHSYRYAWAERAKACGYPERFAQEALGHGSKAVHRAYAKKAQVNLPPLEEYERKQSAQKE